MLSGCTNYKDFFFFLSSSFERIASVVDSCMLHGFAISPLWVTDHHEAHHTTLRKYFAFALIEFALVRFVNSTDYLA